MEDTPLTPHFRLSEFSRSQTANSLGIDNSVPKELIPSLRNLCQQVLEPLRQYAGKTIVISSGYRCPALNRAVGGVPNSQHLKGEAADIRIPSKEEGHNWYLWIMDNLPFDQILWERKGDVRWIHVSCKRDLSRNRHQSSHGRS